MTDAPQSEELSPLQKAAYALKEMRARLDAAEGALREPIAIVGMGAKSVFEMGFDMQSAACVESVDQCDRALVTNCENVACCLGPIRPSNASIDACIWS